MMAPKVMSIAASRDLFLSLIYSYRLKTFGTAPRERRKRRLVVDLKNVTRLELDAAIVLTAEYHRHLILHPLFRPVIDDREWSPEVRALLRQLGFYQLVRAWKTTAHDSPVLDGTRRFVQFHVGKRVEQTEAKKLIESLKAAAGQEPEREYIYTALVEAIKNVKQHAYSSADPFGIPSVGQWWVGGAYDPVRNVLQVVAYDQGVGIPTTLEKQSWFQSILRFAPLEFDDADIIGGAIRYSRTRMRAFARGRTRSVDDGEGRGNGLWAICHFIRELDGSSVRIVSGHGEVIVAGRRAVEKKHHANPFCGTLIEWNLQMPALPSGCADQGAGQ